MLYGKEGTVTLEEVQASLRTKELTKFKDLRDDENGEGLIVSRGNGGGRGNRRKSDNKSKFKCFMLRQNPKLILKMINFND